MAGFTLLGEGLAQPAPSVRVCLMIRLLSAMVLTALSHDSQRPAEHVEVLFLDVGQAEAIVIRSPEGRVALVDAGLESIVADLRRHGIDAIDVAIATHPHADHIGGMAEVLRTIPVRYYMDNSVPHTTSTYRRLMETLQASDVTYLRPTGRTIGLGSVRLTVLPPPSAADDMNDQSIGLLVEYGNFSTLLTGDAQVEELNHFLGLGVPRVTLLKASHHGARDGVTPAWLAATRPEVVVISVGRDNAYGHPSPWALRYYAAVTPEVYRTDQHGEILVWGRGDGSYEVATTGAGPGKDEP
jgi:beta-lactamase superfamily II metal-dependent hydrolase